MNAKPKNATEGAAALLGKANPAAPALRVDGQREIAVKAATRFGGHTFAEDFRLAPPEGGYKPGTDYVVRVTEGDAEVVVNDGALTPDQVLGGFHFAPGGNATGRSGGDDVPAINPHSVWDASFRPACPDPRGMVLVQGPAGPFWCDIYLLGADHLVDGTSRHGVRIADGDTPPQNPAGSKLKRFEFEHANAVLAHHGKQLLSLEEFFAAAFGVTERTAAGTDPKVTGLDAARTSRWGLMQAAGNLWVWGHDGDPDVPRACLLGGAWWGDGLAGSRRANVDVWPGNSDGDLGARGRCDHLNPA